MTPLTVIASLLKAGESINTLTDLVFFFFQAEDGIRDLVRSRGLGDVYKETDIDADGNIVGLS